MCLMNVPTQTHSQLSLNVVYLWGYENLLVFYRQFDVSLSKLQGSVQNSYKDMDDKHKTLRKQLSNYHAKILYCLDELGLICAYEV